MSTDDEGEEVDEEPTVASPTKADLAKKKQQQSSEDVVLSEDDEPMQVDDDKTLTTSRTVSTHCFHSIFFS